MSPARILTDDEVKQIREKYHEGNVSQEALADEYEVGQPHISMLVRGRHREDAGGPIKDSDQRVLGEESD